MRQCEVDGVTLDELIRTVEGAATSDDALDRLSAAMTVKADVDELTDSLIGHYVDQARRAGHSWSQIGGAMGVSKQAAQQKHADDGEVTADDERFKPWKLGRFTPRARRVVRQAQREARDFGHTWIGTEHLALALHHTEEGLAAKILRQHGVERDALRQKIVERLVAL